MSFKAAIRAYLCSNSAVMDELSQRGAVAIPCSGATTLIAVSLLTTAPPARGQLLLKNSSGNYELVNYTAVEANESNYDFTVSVTLQNAYDTLDYCAIADGIYSFPVPQAASLPYCVIERISTDDILNKLNGPATVIMESWQVSVYASTDAKAESVKDDVVAALNLVNPTTWSDDGFSTAYTVYTSVWTSEVTIPDLDLDGSQDAFIHKPLTFGIKRSIASA